MAYNVTEVGMQDLVEKLGYTREQVEFTGRCLSLSKNKGLIEKLEIEYSHINDIGGSLVYVGKKQQIQANFKLKEDLKNFSHGEIARRIKHGLSSVGISGKGFFSYCEKSYGIEEAVPRVSIHFGFG